MRGAWTKPFSFIKFPRVQCFHEREKEIKDEREIKGAIRKTRRESLYHGGERFLLSTRFLLKHSNIPPQTYPTSTQ